MKLRAGVVVLLLLVAAVGAGCITAAKKDEPVKKATPKPRVTSPSPDSRGLNPDEFNQTLGKRWHFHNYWGLNPNLTLFEADVALEAAAPSVSFPPPRATLGQTTFGLPYGRIVPPETGTITVTVLYNESPVLGMLNVSYRPANVNDFLAAGSVGAGGSVQIPVAADMTDVPHRGRSVWAFRLTAAGDAPAAFANGTVHVTIVATIGRPIFIDPPHLDHWRGADTVPVVAGEEEVAAVKLPGQTGSYLAPGTDGTATRPALATFRVVDGLVVPEGTKVVLVRLTWTSELPPEVVVPGLVWSEENFGTSDVAAPVSDKAGERLYRIAVTPRQTDSPYANQSTWAFQVVLSGDANAFAGKVRVDAWASKLAVDSAPFPAGAAAPTDGARAAAATPQVRLLDRALSSL